MTQRTIRPALADNPRAPATRAHRAQLAELAGVGPWLPLTRAEIAGAVPVGAQRSRSQSRYLAACQTEPELAGVRADREGNLLEFVRVLARYASWGDRTTRPTRARVCAEAGFSVSTFKACRRWWEQRGYLGTVRAGYSPHLRPGSLADDSDPNEAAVYVLCEPAKRRPGTRPNHPTAITRPLTGNPAGAVTTRARSNPKSRAEGARLTPGTHCRRHVDVLKKGPGQTISDARGAWLARPFIAAGWTSADVAFALAHHPADGRYRSPVSDVTKPGAWLFWRLSRWLDDPERAWSHYVATGQLAPDLHPVASRAQRETARAARDRARLDQLAGERARRAAAWVDPAPHAAAIRATLQARREVRQ